MVQLPVVACGVNRRLIIEREGMTYGLFDALVAPAFSAHGDIAVVAAYFELIAFGDKVAVGIDAGVDDGFASAGAGALYLID